jgi:hypothetical protein
VPRRLRRGRPSRRFDVVKGTAPPLARELRVLAGCALHGPRLRVHERPGADRALARAAARGAGGARAGAARPDFLSGASGTVGGSARRAAARRATRGSTSREAPASRAAAPRRAPRAAAPARAGAGHRAPGLDHGAARAELRAAGTTSTVVTAPPGTRGKFENLNALLPRSTVGGHDWLLVVDDDVALPRGFLDASCAPPSARARLAQPAHRLHSHAAGR